MRVLDIVAGTSVDGPGLRTSIYFAGCTHHCPGCHNPQSWDSEGGKEMSVDEIVDRIVDEDFNVTFSGGDPLLQVDELCILAEKIKALGKNIWLYTGYTIEQIRQTPHLAKILKHVDTVVDGPFVESKRDVSLLFRGSSNQRIIHLHPNQTIIEFSTL